MLPAGNSGSNASGRDHTIRTIFVSTVTALIGTIVGGLSVLGVVIAVTRPPNHEVRADPGPTATTTTPAAPAVAAAQPPMRPATSAAGANAPTTATTPPQPASPPAQAQMAPGAPDPAPQPQIAPPAPPAATAAQAPTPPAQGQQNTWPDALSARSRHSPKTEPQGAAPLQGAQSVAPTIAPDGDNRTVMSKETKSEEPLRGYDNAESQAHRSKKFAQEAKHAKKRPATTPRGSEPERAASDDDGDGAVVGERRPLYDYYSGHGHGTRAAGPEPRRVIVIPDQDKRSDEPPAGSRSPGGGLFNFFGGSNDNWGN